MASLLLLAMPFVTSSVLVTRFAPVLVSTLSLVELFSSLRQCLRPRCAKKTPGRGGAVPPSTL